MATLAQCFSTTISFNPGDWQGALMYWPLESTWHSLSPFIFTTTLCNISLHFTEFKYGSCGTLLYSEVALLNTLWCFLYSKVIHCVLSGSRSNFCVWSFRPDHRQWRGFAQQHTWVGICPPYARVGAEPAYCSFLEGVAVHGSLRQPCSEACLRS